MAKYVKLGEKASMFYDPTLNLKVLPKKVIELPKNYRIGKITMRAIANGHLLITDKNDTIHDEEDEETEDVVDATEAAIKLMDENGVDHKEVTGTGTDGRITKGDVENFLDED